MSDPAARRATPQKAADADDRTVAAGPRDPEHLSERERRWAWLVELPFLACAVAALAWLPAERALNPLLCLLLVAGYAVAVNVRIPLGLNGYAPATQLVFVPMLFLAPLSLVPLLVLAGAVAGDLFARRPLARLALRPGDSWYSVGPVLVLSVAGHDSFAWEHWPVYALALAAQLAVDALAGYVRIRLYEDERPRPREVWGVPAAIDLVLTAPALSVVAVADDAPVAAVLTCAALLIVARGFTSERRGRLAERNQATHDPLTGLPNRVLFEELAEAAGRRARRDREPCAVMVVDLDAFKAVNDELGHAAGDRVLVQVAARLRGVMRGADSVARLGGDEFAVLLSGHQTEEACERVSRQAAPGLRPAVRLAVRAARDHRLGGRGTHGRQCHPRGGAARRRPRDVRRQAAAAIRRYARTRT